MNQKNRLVIGLFAGAFLVLLALGCSEDPPEAPETPEAPEAEKELTPYEDRFTQLSNPDEVFQSLLREYSSDQLSAVLDTSTVAQGANPEQTAFLIGARSVHAALATLLGDFDRAEAIANGIQEAAESLNVQSARVEEILLRAKESFEIRDAAEKQAAVRADIIDLVGAIGDVFRDLNDDSLRILVELGVWSESIATSSDLFLVDYNPVVSGVLNRGNEVEYFATEIQSLRDPHDLLVDALEDLFVIGDAMRIDPDGEIAEANIATISEAVSALQSRILN